MSENTDVQVIDTNPVKEAYLKAIKADGASDNEISHMFYIAENHGLDPLLKEIYLLPFKNARGKREFLPYVSYNGLVKCAHKSGFFDGIEEELVFSTDGKIIGARARVWVKGFNHPCSSMVMMSEYNKGYSVWASMPGAMIMKCAKARALRDAFNLEGLYIEEEFMSPSNVVNESLKQDITERKRLPDPVEQDDTEPAF